MERYDVAVVGAGLAGLVCARDLAARGLRVLLLDQKPELARAVHTTGIFVRRTLEDFALPEDCLGPVIRRVTLYSPRRRALELESAHDEFRVGRMGALYDRWRAEAERAGATWAPATRLAGARVVGGSVELALDGGGARRASARFVIGADGVTSTVARAFGLDENREWIVGVEDVLDGVPLAGPPRLHCFLEPRLAPGYLAWVVHDHGEVHVGVGGYATGFRPAAALDEFRAGLAGVVDLAGARRVERRGGRIPVGGLLPRIVGPRALLVGDASGAVSPLTAGGLDPCLRQSALAVRVVAAYLDRGDPASLAPYASPRLRARFRARRLMRRTFAAARTATLLELGCAALRLPGLRALAGKVFFGRGSFPDLDEARA